MISYTIQMTVQKVSRSVGEVIKKWMNKIIMYLLN